MKNLFLTLFALLGMTMAMNAQTVDDIKPMLHSYVMVFDNYTGNGTVSRVQGSLFGSNYFLDLKGGSIATNKGSIDIADPSTYAVTYGGAEADTARLASKYTTYGKHYNSLRLKNAQDVIALKPTAGSVIYVFGQGNKKTGSSARVPKFATDDLMQNVLNEAPTDDYPASDSYVYKFTVPVQFDGNTPLYIGSYNGDAFFSFIVVEANEAAGTPSVEVASMAYDETSKLYYQEVTCTPNNYTLDGVDLGPTQVYYTTDGTEPTDASTLYTGPIKCYKNMVVKFQAYWSGDICEGASNEATVEFKFNAPTLTVDGVNATIATGYKNATNYYSINGAEGVAGDTYTATTSCNISAYTVIKNGNYATWTSPSFSSSIVVVSEKDWANTFIVKAADVFVNKEINGYTYPSEFEMEITYYADYDMYLITKFFGNDISMLNNGGISLKISDVNPKEAEIITTAAYLKTIVAGESYLTLKDLNLSTSPITLTHNGDGTLSISDFCVSYMTYDANWSQKHELAAFYSGVNAIEGTLEIEPEPEPEVFSWANTFNVKANNVTVFKDIAGYTFPTEFEMEIIYNADYDLYLVTKFLGEDISALNYGGLSFKLSASEPDKAEIATTAGYLKTIVAGESYLTLKDMNLTTSPITLTRNADGTLSISDFCVSYMTYDASWQQQHVPAAWYSGVTTTEDEGSEDQPVTASNSFSLSDISVFFGSSFSFPVSMTNENGITAFQCDVYLPEGLMLNWNDEGEYDVVLNADRKATTHSMTASLQPDGAIRIVSYSSANKLFKGNEGELFTLNLTALDGCAENQKIEIRNIRLSTPDQQEYLLPNVSSTVSVKSYTPADANGDGEVTIVDVVAVVNALMGDFSGNFVFDAADMDQNGEITIVDVVAVVNTLMGGGEQEETPQEIMDIQLETKDGQVIKNGSKVSVNAEMVDMMIWGQVESNIYVRNLTGKSQGVYASVKTISGDAQICWGGSCVPLSEGASHTTGLGLVSANSSASLLIESLVMESNYMSVPVTRIVEVTVWTDSKPDEKYTAIVTYYYTPSYFDTNTRPVATRSNASILRSNLHVTDAEVNAGESTTLYVKLDKAQAYTAMQMDMNLPEGLAIEGVEMVGDASHTVTYNEAGRIAAYSLGNSRFHGGEALMAITVKADDSFTGAANVGFTNVRVVSTDIVETVLADALSTVIGGAKSIDGVEADENVQILYYSTTGAVSDAPHKGLNIIKRIWQDGRVEVNKIMGE